MSILQIALPPQPHSHLSFSRTLISPPHHRLFIPANAPVLHLPSRLAPIRMGGGPRTYPGGVSKWQWKRMQAKKAKQLLKARLTRERQIYEMRKRAELKAAVSELERPWEAVERAPTLFSVSADEQLKVLADRFQKPGGFDMWSENDGPELFKTVDGLPSARFFPKGVVHSVKPYGKVAELEGPVEGVSESDEELDGFGKDRRISSHRSRRDELDKSLEAQNSGAVGRRKASSRRNHRNSSRRASPKPYQRLIGDSQLDDLMDESASVSGNDVRVGEQRFANVPNRMSSAGRMRGRDVYNLDDGFGSSGLDLKSGGKRNGKPAKGGKSNGRPTKNKNSRMPGASSARGSRENSQVGFDRKQRGDTMDGGFRSGRSNRKKGLEESDAGVYDMSLLEDGSYGL